RDGGRLGRELEDPPGLVDVQATDQGHDPARLRRRPPAEPGLSLDLHPVVPLSFVDPWSPDPGRLAHARGPLLRAVDPERARRRELAELVAAPRLGEVDGHTRAHGLCRDLMP